MPSKFLIFLLLASSLLINLSDGRSSTSSVGFEGTHPPNKKIKIVSGIIIH
jgi:hypothetical protein